MAKGSGLTPNLCMISALILRLECLSHGCCTNNVTVTLVTSSLSSLLRRTYCTASGRLTNIMYLNVVTCCQLACQLARQ